ncbi:branched-chain amino acid ABC transporter permease [Rhodosalinus halophilus]|uniref:Branched-chain amino acid ABC transporter permease n=1 Tax=Rhodosalinus halophilus TaxID=2259333 RepID=A0A365U4J7_9RHOB|nr:branched-chain amino acid ABC transporter permease [Rhodosalinus halophilus]RBI83138.1 branched-chain amino acid ABC transporter permease [Rhodosalinus halophilus]
MILVQTLVYGLALGGVIAVSAVGLTLAYGVTRFINFAFGEFLTLGAFLCLLFAQIGLGLPVAGLLAVAAVGVIGVGVARAFYTPLMNRGLLPLLVTSVGVAFVVQNLVRMIAGSNPIRFPVPLMRPIEIGGVFVPREQLVILGVALAAMLAVHLLLSFTMLGKKMRAVADDPALARVSGISSRRVLDATWFVSALIGGLGGILLAITQITLAPQMGWHFLLVVFAAVLLGGIGSPYGAMIGGLLIGLAMELGATYVAANYSYAFAFVVLIAVLILRPRGLMGGRG